MCGLGLALFFRKSGVGGLGVDPRRIHDISLKWKLLIPFLFLSFVGTSFLILLSLHTQKRVIEAQEKKQLSDYYSAFSNQLSDRERSALSLAYQVAKSPAVQQAFARRDRGELIDLLLPSYKVLRQRFDVKQFHFHTKPATSFLRLHRPYQSGEEMQSYRRTIMKVIESAQGIAGLEWGVTGFAVRGVVPVYYRDKLLGTFEVGFPVERPFLEALKRRYQMDLTLLVAGEDGTGFSQIAFSAPNVPLFSNERYGRVFQSQESLVLVSPAVAPELAVFLGPLLDFSGKSIGVVQISVDRGSTMAQLRRNRNVMVAIMVAALALSSILILGVTVIFLRPVHEIVGMAREIAEGRRVKRIQVPAHDEIGTLADSLNEMLDSLNQAREEIQQYCDTLEERVQARTTELVEEKEKFETLVENAPLIVYRIEADGTNVFVNQFVEEILGYTPTEVIDDRDFWSRSAHPEDRQKIIRQLGECLAEGREFLMEYRGIHKNGQEVFLLNHAIPLFGRQGKVDAVDGIIVDVSERKRLQEKIIQTEELKTLSKISARLAHEIRNPLTSAGGFARRLLQKMDRNDSNRNKVEIIVHEVARLEQILKMILSYIRPISLEFSQVNLNDLLREAIGAAGEQLGSKEIRLELALDHTLPDIRADRYHLKHVMETILKTAGAHMRRGSRLEVSTTCNGGATIQLCYPALHVADDDMEHFFSPFVANGLEESDIAVPLTKVVIHKHGGIVNIDRDEQERIVIKISFPKAGARVEPG
ncbi:MAG: PAS domain S-box protein [Deltaproteobacteria bacterium]|nr:MAG: PAS domain S-box protein [Deltaproteobacteria bacterium]